MTRKIWHALASPLVIIPPLAVWFLVGLVTYAMPLNSLRLRWMERNVLRWEHPEDSRLLARHSELGRFGGGSADFCEFWAGELRQSSLHGEELVNFYRSQRGEDVVLVYRFDEPESELNFAPMIPTSFPLQEQGAEEVSDEPGVYLVYSYINDDGSGDPRCW